MNQRTFQRRALNPPRTLRYRQPARRNPSYDEAYQACVKETKESWSGWLVGTITTLGMKELNPAQEAACMAKATAESVFSPPAAPAPTAPAPGAPAPAPGAPTFQPATPGFQPAAAPTPGVAPAPGAKDEEKEPGTMDSAWFWPSVILGTTAVASIGAYYYLSRQDR